MLAFAVRHFVRHWRINLVVLVGLVLGCTLLSALPIYASQIAGKSLVLSLEQAYASERNLKLSGVPASQRAWAEGAGLGLSTALGDLLQSWIEIREATIDAERAVYSPKGTGDDFVQRPVHEMLYLHFWSLDVPDSDLSEHVRLVSGRWPGAPQPEEMCLACSPGVVPVPLVEAAVGSDAAAVLGLRLGDELLRCSDLNDDACFWVRITAILTPRDPYHDVWWSDPSLPTFSVERVPSMSRVDDLYLSLVVTTKVMDEYLPDHTLHWRVLLDWRAITADRAESVREQLINLTAGFSASSVAAHTGLVQLIERYQHQQRLSQVMLLLLSVQSLLAVLYSLGTISAFVLDRSQLELATLVGRGFGDEQIARLFGLEGAVLALGLAFPLGPLLARLLLSAWSRAGVSRGSWLLSLVAALFGWLALVIPLYLSLRRGRGATASPWLQGKGPASRQWGRLAFEALLLVLGGLAYWQLLRAGTFVRAEGTDSLGADPVLLIGPTLFFVALGFVLLRVVRPLLNWGAWAAGALRGLVLPLSLRQLARESQGTAGWSASERALLLVCLSTAMVVFSAVSRDSVSFSQEERAQALAGADLRLGLPLGVSVRDEGAGTEHLPGVLAASPVCRVQSRWGQFQGRNVNYIDVRLVGVDPGTLSQVAHLGDGPASGAAMISALQQADDSAQSEVLPALLSPDAPPRGVKVGDRVYYYVGGRQLEFEVLGLVNQFPTLERPFVLTHLSALDGQVNLKELLASSQATCEWWLDVEPAQHADLVQMLRAGARLPDLKDRPLHYVVDDALAHLRAFQGDLVAGTTLAALGLNALAMALLSVLSYVMTQLLMVRRRRIEFSVLRAVGVAGRQILALLALESVVVVGLGLVTGTGLGYGLAHAMRAFVALVLVPSMGEGSLAGLVVSWPALIRLGLLLLVGYGLALGLLLVVVMRANVQQALRLPEE